MRRCVGGRNVILKTIGMVYGSLPSMGPCSEPGICLNSEHISARAAYHLNQPADTYPMPAVGPLMNVRSHVIANAAISPYRKGNPLASSSFAHCRTSQ